MCSTLGLTSNTLWNLFVIAIIFYFLYLGKGELLVELIVGENIWHEKGDQGGFFEQSPFGIQ